MGDLKADFRDFEIARLLREKAELVAAMKEAVFEDCNCWQCTALKAALRSVTDTKGARNRPLPTTRCDCCDNGLDDDWDYCPFCGRNHPDATETKDGQT